MSAGWEIGDLAVCVDASPCRYNPYAGAPFGIESGEVLTVADCGRDIDGVAVLWFDERDAGECCGFDANRFRKILPDEHEACETEFVTLLNRIKQPVEAERSALFMGGK